MGYREYSVANGKAEKMVSDYIEDWRRSYEDCKKSLDNFKLFMGWASGPDQVKYLGRAKSELEKILAAIQRFPAVEVRLQRDEGLDKISLQVQIQKITDTLRLIKASQNKTGGKSGGGGGRAGAGGGKGTEGG